MTFSSGLANSYAEFLADPARLAPALAGSLRQAEWWVESDWLDLFAKGTESAMVTQPFSRQLGRRLWIGRDLPTEAAAGDIWFDVLEVIPMILLPSEPLGWREEHPLITYPPLHSWISCRPTAQWQYDGYRLLHGHGRPSSSSGRWARGTAQTEAKDYATYMGKLLAGHHDWQGVVEFVSSPTLDDMWAEQAGEWSGERSDYDEDLAFVVTSETFHLDLDDVLDAHDLENAPDPRGVTVFPRDTGVPGIGFRTAVSVQDGLFGRPEA